MVARAFESFDPASVPRGAVMSRSFDRVYEDHFALVWRNARRLGVEPAHLDDVLQDVFVVVHRRLGDVEDRPDLRGWVISILFGVVKNHRRALRRRGDETRETDAATIAVAGDGGPEERAARSEAARVVHMLLAELDDDKRQVFVLAELEQLPVPEIAVATATNVNTVYARLRAARRDFNAALARFQLRDTRRLR